MDSQCNPFAVTLAAGHCPGTLEPKNIEKAKSSNTECKKASWGQLLLLLVKLVCGLLVQRLWA